MTHNAKFSQKSGLDWLKMANSGHFAVFPYNEAQIHSEWPFSCNSQLFPSFATKASHFIQNLKNLHFFGEKVYQQIFSVFQLFGFLSHQTG